MEEEFTVAACQIYPAFLDKKKNLSKIGDFLKEAAEKKAKLVVFPECAVTGYVGYRKTIDDVGLIKRFHQVAELIPGPASKLISKKAKEAGVYVATGFLERDPKIKGIVYNSSILVSPQGNLIGRHRKVHIPLLEHDYFKASSTIQVFDTEIARIGLGVCYDTCFPEFVRAQALLGADIHVSMTNCVPSFNVSVINQPIVRAWENGVFVVSCNRVGKDEETGLEYCGLSSITSPLGNVLARAKDEETIITAGIELRLINEARIMLPMIRDMRTDVYCAGLIADEECSGST